MKKSNFRWVIIALLFSLNIISYVDRSAMSYAVKDIMQSLGINFTEIGIVLGAFGIGYFITDLCGGITVDRYGPRLTILICVLFWVLAIGSTGLAVGFVSVYLSRFCLGLGEGPNFPAVARTISDWLPTVARAKALANALVAVPLSLAIGGPIISFLLIAMGWRWMFIILGVVLLIWWPFWWYFYANKPKESRYVNKAELDYIEKDKMPDQPKLKERAVWLSFFTNPTILSNNWAFFVFGYGLFFYLTWLPDYLEVTYHLNIKQVGLFSFLPWFLGAVFLWCVGYLSDYIYAKTKKLRYARSYPIMLGQLLSVLSILPILYWHTLTVTLISLSLTIAFSLSNNTVFYATNVDVAKERAGSCLALMNAGFAISGFLAPTLTGWLVQISGSFRAAFVTLVILTFSSVLAVFFSHKPDKISMPG